MKYKYFLFFSFFVVDLLWLWTKPGDVPNLSNPDPDKNKALLLSLFALIWFLFLFDNCPTFFLIHYSNLIEDGSSSAEFSTHFLCCACKKRLARIFFLFFMNALPDMNWVKRCGEKKKERYYQYMYILVIGCLTYYCRMLNCLFYCLLRPSEVRALVTLLDAFFCFTRSSRPPKRKHKPKEKVWALGVVERDYQHKLGNFSSILHFLSKPFISYI